MKHALVGLVVGLMLAAGTAFGATQWSHKAYGVWCKTNTAKGAGTMVLCVPMTGKGYGVGISRDLIMVVNLRTEKVVFTRMHSEN